MLYFRHKKTTTDLPIGLRNQAPVSLVSISKDSHNAVFFMFACCR